MGKFQIEQCGQIEGLYLIQPTVFGDNRGYFMEHITIMNSKNWDWIWSLYRIISQKSTKGVLRGMHYQKRTYTEQACPCDQR